MTKQATHSFKKGQTIIFTKIPNGSYLSTDTAYLIEKVGKREVWFRNIVTGGATYDPIVMILRTAIYTIS